jgi:hypothetical protein
MPGLTPPPLSTSTPGHKHSVVHSFSAPTGLPSSTYTFPSSASTPPGSSQLRKPSPTLTTIHSTDSPHHAHSHARSISSSRKMTPASSKSTSPRHAPAPLPPNTPRRSSVFGGRDLLESELLRRGSLSLLRRPSISISTPSVHSTSPGEKTGGDSLRHVGEGALDDSDSSSASGSSESEGGVDDEGGSSDGEYPIRSPGLPHMKTVPTPSPLSRVAGRQHWTEDEGDGAREYEDEDEASPSPGSTGSDSSGSSSLPRRRKSSGSNSHSRPRRQVKRFKSRSRSSTVALLAAPAPPRPARQHSNSSIRTVTAGEVSFRELERDGHGLKGEGTFRDARGGILQTQSEFGPGSVIEDGIQSGIVAAESEDMDLAKLTDRLVEVVRADEKRYRGLAWDAIRQALEGFANEVCICP